MWVRTFPNCNLLLLQMSAEKSTETKSRKGRQIYPDSSDLRCHPEDGDKSTTGLINRDTLSHLIKAECASIKEKKPATNIKR